MDKLYYGIDLGTTNSAISYGYMGSNGKIVTQICKVNRYGKEGGIESKEVLPSVVYYKQDAKTGEIKSMIGDFAKNQYGKKYGNVMKSVKNFMGTYEELSLDKKIEDKRPEEVSSKILKHLLAGVKDKLSLSEEPQNVIITIPASFDSDQCNATLEAAYLAGLTTKDKNGNYIKDVLLYEPKAVIYNVANMIANDEIPSTIINFNDEKNVLVFDLGGGTLDVALYKVHNNKVLDFPIIDEIAVGRYTRIGGDDFDKLLSEKLVDEFLKYNGCSSSDFSTEELFQLMESRAEYIKLELSDKVSNSKISGSKIPDDHEFEISEMDIYKGMEFEAYLTKKDIENILSPIMGNHLKLEDVNKIDGFTSEKDLNNIIYPILDVLAKAKEYGKNTKVDAVILNGGMTKFYLIKERIKKFFDLEPVTVNDPDLSVAKGAAFYQYCLDKLKINQIEYNLNRISEDRVTVSEEKKGTLLQLGSSVVNDTINLGLSKGYVLPIVKSGTQLPTGDIEINADLKIPVGTNRIELPIYLGRGKNTGPPNRKIATRIIELKQKYAAGTLITLVVNVDENKTLTLTALIGENKQERVSVSIDTDSHQRENTKSNKIISTSSNVELNPSTEMETLKANAEILENYQKNTGKKTADPQVKQKQVNAKFKISQTLTDIKNCSNKKQFEKLVLDNLGRLENHKLYKGYLFEIGVSIFTHMSDEGKNKFKSYCRDIVNINYMPNNFNKDNIIKAIIAIGEIQDTDSIKQIEKLILETRAKLYHTNLVRTLGKLSLDNNLISKKFLEMPTDNLELDSYIYAIGKSFSREQSEKNDKEVEKIMSKLINIIKLEKSNKDMALVSLGEIGSSLDGIVKKIDEKVIEKIGAQLANYTKDLESGSHRDKAELVLNVIYGLNLNEDEKKHWSMLKSK